MKDIYSETSIRKRETITNKQGKLKLGKALLKRTSGVY